MIEIRPATPDDSKYIIEFQQKMALETENVQLDTTVLAQGLKLLFEDPARGNYYVAADNKDVIGCMMITYEWS